MYKIILCGDRQVGKTSIRLRYIGKGFSFDVMPTLGVEFSVKKLTNTEVQIWDISGDQNYAPLRQQYYQGAHGILLVFDLSSWRSFNQLRTWVKELTLHTNSNVPIILVGNKEDLLNEAKDPVGEDGINGYLETLEKIWGTNIGFFRSSAKTGLNIDMLFEKMIEKIGF